MSNNGGFFKFVLFDRTLFLVPLNTVIQVPFISTITLLVVFLEEVKLCCSKHRQRSVTTNLWATTRKTCWLSVRVVYFVSKNQSNSKTWWLFVWTRCNLVSRGFSLWSWSCIRMPEKICSPGWWTNVFLIFCWYQCCYVVPFGIGNLICQPLAYCFAFRLISNPLENLCGAVDLLPLMSTNRIHLLSLFWMRKSSHGSLT